MEGGKMRDFIDLKKPCPACGSKDISRKYWEKGDDMGSHAYDYEVAKEDLIRSLCRTCQFKWYNRPLNRPITGKGQAVDFMTAM